MRDRLNCLTRKTHAFAKEVETWDAPYRLTLVEQNWRRPQLAVRVPLPVLVGGRRYNRRPPAMALHLTDHQGSWQEFFLFRVMQC